MRSEGGKAPRPPGPGRILQPGEPMVEIPGAPAANRLAVTGHVGRDAEMRRCLWSRRTYTQATPNG
jgi:hypothetical protein